jgi:hypothetical protein
VLELFDDDQTNLPTRGRKLSPLFFPSAWQILLQFGKSYNPNLGRELRFAGREASRPQRRRMGAASVPNGRIGDAS